MDCPKCKNTVFESSYQPEQTNMRLGGLSALTREKLPETHVRLGVRYHCDKCNTSFIVEEAGF